MVSWSVQFNFLDLDFLSLILGIYKCTDWILESLVCASPPSILTVVFTTDVSWVDWLDEMRMILG